MDGTSSNSARHDREHHTGLYPKAICTESTVLSSISFATSIKDIAPLASSGYRIYALHENSRYLTHLDNRNHLTPKCLTAHLLTTIYKQYFTIKVFCRFFMCILLKSAIRRCERKILYPFYHTTDIHEL